MLKSLENLQLGRTSPTMFQNYVQYRRMIDLKLNPGITFGGRLKERVTHLDLSSDGTLMLCGGSKGGVFVYKTIQDTYTKRCAIPLQAKYDPDDSIGVVFSCQWHPQDNTLFTTCHPTGVLVWDAENVTAPLETLQKDHKANTSHHMCPLDPTKVAVTFRTQYENIGVYIWDLRVGSVVQELGRSNESCVRWSPNSSFVIATANPAGTIAEWDIRSHMKPRASFTPVLLPRTVRDPRRSHYPGVWSMRYSPTGLNLIALGHNGKLNTLNMANWSLTSSVYISLHMSISEPTQIHISGERPSVVFVPHDGVVDVVDVTLGTIVNSMPCRTTPMFGESVTSFAFDETLHHGYSAGMQIQLWGSPQPEELCKPQAMKKVPLIDLQNLYY